MLGLKDDDGQREVTGYRKTLSIFVNESGSRSMWMTQQAPKRPFSVNWAARKQ